jgi:carbon monoxide dehydrogenase subunit G
MKIGGHTRLNAPRSEVWETLTDADRITPHLPGGEIVEGDGETWAARLSAPTNLGASTFDFTFRLLERRQEEYVRVFGHGYGSQNVVDLTAELHLSGEGGETEVRWEGDVRLGGVLASLGQRSLRYVIQRQVEWVLHSVEADRSEVQT